MATPFSRSIRILDADRFRPSLWVIGFGVVIPTVWLAWLFLARITLTESGKVSAISPVGQVRAVLSEEQAKKVKVGQPGLITLEGEVGEDLGVITAVVVQPPAANGTESTIELAIVDERFFSAPADDNWKGQVQIEVEKVSPLTLFLRSSGQFLGAPQMTTSPTPPQR